MEAISYNCLCHVLDKNFQETLRKIYDILKGGIFGEGLFGPWKLLLRGHQCFKCVSTSTFCFDGYVQRTPFIFFVIISQHGGLHPALYLYISWQCCSVWAHTLWETAMIKNTYNILVKWLSVGKGAFHQAWQSDPWDRHGRRSELTFLAVLLPLHMCCFTTHSYTSVHTHA